MKPARENYFPAELARVRDALIVIHTLAHPRVGGSVMNPHGARQVDGDVPDPSGRRWRALEKSILAQLGRIADRANVQIAGDTPARRGRRCANCGVGQRPQARHCDQCGKPLEREDGARAS